MSKKSGRQSVRHDPAVAAYLSGEESAPEPESKRKRPRYPSEEKRSKATYDLAPETIDQVREIARQERFGKKQISIVAEALLRYAIQAYEDGKIRLAMVSEPDTWQAEAVETTPESSPNAA